jgi:DNA-binding PadR family transcriptional regulator
MSGYEMTKHFEYPLAHVWTATHSQIYPELARLVADGLIRESERGPRGRKTYAITAAGRAELRRWLLGPRPDRGTRNEGVLRAFFLGGVRPDEAESYLRSEAEHHRGQLAVLQADKALGPFGEKSDTWTGGLVLELGIRYEELLAEWAEWAADQIRRRTRKRSARRRA